MLVILFPEWLKIVIFVFQRRSAVSGAWWEVNKRRWCAAFRPKMKKHSATNRLEPHPQWNSPGSRLKESCCNLWSDSSPNVFSRRFETYSVFLVNGAAGWAERWWNDRGGSAGSFAPRTSSKSPPRAGQTAFPTKHTLKSTFNGHLRLMFSNDLTVIFGFSLNSYKILLRIDVIHKASTGLQRWLYVLGLQNSLLKGSVWL